MGGDGRAPCLLLGQRGLHDEAFPTAATAPRASVLLEDRKSGSGQGRAAPTTANDEPGLPPDSGWGGRAQALEHDLEMAFPYAFPPKPAV